MKKNNIYLFYLLFIILASCFTKNDRVNIPIFTIDYSYDNRKNENVLPIPPLLENMSNEPDKAVFELTVQKGVYEFFKGTKIITYGYNGPYLGPTIRVKRGQNVKIKVKNKLREYTTVHWHGLLVSGDNDGGPHQVINPDGEWNADFNIKQQAATAWYHPHGIGNTAIQVYKGLSGLFIIDDKISDNLNIPKEYGINDIPLIIQDKRFSKEGIPLYITNMNDIMEGMKGNTILVNGVINPVLNVSAIKYRFRILNGSNARIYNINLTNNQSFYQISTDAGFLEKPVKLSNILLSPGERAEIIVDFSKFKKGDFVFVRTGSNNFLKIVITQIKNDKTIIPEKLAIIDWLSMDEVLNNRYFNLQGMGHHVAINNRTFDLNYINQRVKHNSVELWTITSSTGGMMGMMRSNMQHNFHAHGIHFLILTRNGKPAYDNERGWKDTLLLNDGEIVKFITKYQYKGLYMYHCHILEHEDNGMMGQFLVE